MSWEKALGQVPSGIFVVSMEEDGERLALLASWVQQASFEPASITLSVHRDRPLHEKMKKGKTVIVHLLSDQDQEAFKRFAKGVEPGKDPFEGMELRKSASGQPVMKDCMAHLECEVKSKLEAGDHDVFLLDVRAGDTHKEEAPRVHIRKNGLSY